MGYRADYFINTDKYIPTLADDITEESGYDVDDNGDSDYPEVGNDIHMYQAGWDTYEADMTEVSIRHKDVLFTVEERGEEDFFHITYFKNGKSLHSPGRIVYEEVDLTQLD